MRALLLTALFATAALAAQAAPAGSSAVPIAGQSCIAPCGGIAPAAAHMAAPAACCSGRMQCAQFLSTSTMVRPARLHRT